MHEFRNPLLQDFWLSNFLIAHKLDQENPKSKTFHHIAVTRCNVIIAVAMTKKPDNGIQTCCIGIWYKGSACEDKVTAHKTPPYGDCHPIIPLVKLGTWKPGLRIHMTAVKTFLKNILLNMRKYFLFPVNIKNNFLVAVLGHCLEKAFSWNKNLFFYVKSSQCNKNELFLILKTISGEWDKKYYL